MDKIVFCKARDMKEHPNNKGLFGDVRADLTLFNEIRDSIAKTGIQEPVVIKKDGTVLSGHIRLAAFLDLLKQKDNSKTCKKTKDLLRSGMIPCRVHEDFSSKVEELTYLIHSNTQRRHLTPSQRAAVYLHLKELDEVKPLTHKGGRPKKWARKKTLAAAPKPKSRVQAFAENEDIPIRAIRNEARVMTHPLVNDELKAKIDAKEYTIMAVLAAIKDAQEVAEREHREPTSLDVLLYLEHMRGTKKPSVSTLISEVVPAPEPDPSKSKKVPKKRVVVPPVKEAVAEEVPSSVEGIGEEVSTHVEEVKVSTHPVEEAVPSSEPTPVNRFTTLRLELEEALSEVDFSPKTTQELLAIHSRLTGFLKGAQLLA